MKIRSKDRMEGKHHETSAVKEKVGATMGNPTQEKVGDTRRNPDLETDDQDVEFDQLEETVRK